MSFLDIFETQVEYYEKSLEITKVIGDIVVEAESYPGIGLIHFKKNGFDTKSNKWTLKDNSNPSTT